MSIMEYNGAAIIAMKGKNCVAIAADTRLGVQMQTVSTNFQKIFPMSDKLMVGLAGLATDVQTLSEQLVFRTNMYELREHRTMQPKTFMHCLSSMLYERRFGPYFAQPVVAGLDSNNVPFIAGMDLIGSAMISEDFVVAGTCEENLFGMCESLWEPNLEAEDLFETIAQALMNAVDRDCISGWGAVVHVIESDKVTTRRLKTRMD